MLHYPSVGGLAAFQKIDETIDAILGGQTRTLLGMCRRAHLFLFLFGKPAAVRRTHRVRKRKCIAKSSGSPTAAMSMTSRIPIIYYWSFKFVGFASGHGGNKFWLQDIRHFHFRPNQITSFEFCEALSDINHLIDGKHGSVCVCVLAAGERRRAPIGVH